MKNRSERGEAVTGLILVVFILGSMIGLSVKKNKQAQVQQQQNQQMDIRNDRQN